MSAGTGNFYEIDAVIVFAGPIRNLRWISTIILDDVFCKIMEQDVLPGDKDSGILVWRFFKLILQAFNLHIAKCSVNGQAATDRSGLNGHERTDIIVARGAI